MCSPPATSAFSHTAGGSRWPIRTKFRDASRSSVPWIVRPWLAFLGVSDFVEMREQR
jgi:hypothetical protein